MARTGTGARETFLVEHYRPGLTAAELGAWAAWVRDATDEVERAGKPLRYVSAAVVPTDESLFCIFEAASEQLVREAYARAGIPFERITAVIPDGTWSGTSRYQGVREHPSTGGLLDLQSGSTGGGQRHAMQGDDATGGESP